MARQDLIDDLQRLAGVLGELDPGPPGPDHPGHLRDRLLCTVTSYLVPRLAEPAAPLTVVFAGPTGAGKSTLVNSLARRRVSSTGPLRPTTHSPVVLTAPAWASRLSSIGGVECAVVTGEAGILETMALVDTPDVDSNLTAHRETAEILIDHADVVVFVTSALRYADRVPWEVLRRAISRGAPVISVLNRLSSGSAAAVSDYRARLADAGLGDDLIRVPEYHLDPRSHALPSLAVRRLGKRLASIATDRAAFQERLIDRVLEAVASQGGRLADALEDRQAEAAAAEDRFRGALTFDLDATDLAPAAAAVSLGEYPAGRRWRERLWARRNRISRRQMAETLSRVRRRMVASVETDLRLSALRASGHLAGPSPRLPPDVDLSIGSAVDAWFDFVSRMARHGSPFRANLAVATLIKHSLGGGYGPAVAEMFGEPEAGVSERARRELSRRVDIVYAQAAEHLAGHLRPASGRADAGDLRACLDSLARRTLANA